MYEEQSQLRRDEEHSFFWMVKKYNFILNIQCTHENYPKLKIAEQHAHTHARTNYYYE